MLEKGLLSIKWSLFDSRACHVIGDAPWPQHFALRLHCGVGGRHHNTDALSKSQTFWHGMAPCLKRASHAMPLSLKSSKSQIAPQWLSPMSKPQRFSDWTQSTLQQRRAAFSAAIARATRLEARLHAFVQLSARQEISSQTGSLAFLPYAAKDLFFANDHLPCCGLTTAIGTDRHAYADALRDLDQAGGSRIGFTAMTELACEPSGFNAVSGYPRNPWNYDFIPGGSSSGSAVAVASGASVIALGSDTGGSIRIPAHCCGVTGFKPSFGAVSTAGAVPLAPFLDCIGVLARSAADLAPVAA